MRTVRRVWQWLTTLPVWVADASLMLLLIAVGLAYLWLVNPAHVPLSGVNGPGIVDVTLVVAANIPVALRRRFPIGVLIAVSLLTLLSIPLVVPVTATGLLVALYTVAANRSRQVSLIAMGVVAVGYIAVLGIYLGKWDFVVTGLVAIPGAWVLGAAQRLRRQYHVALKRRAMQLEREQVQQARLAVTEERVRIARELHDVLAHHVSVMGIQAAAARRVLIRRPSDAAVALESIEAASRQAMDELHQLVGLLRRDEETGERDLAPQPDLAQLPALVAGMRDAGLAVDLRIEGNQRSLPPAVELSAFRIVQEALTNALQHAGPVHAWVIIRYHDRHDGLDIDVIDDGPGPQLQPRSGGNGLVGMRERVNLHGGRLETGPRPEGGFGVHAVLDGRN